VGKNEDIRAKYLIIGNSAGGIGAAEAIREVDKAGSITIVSDEPYPSYSRPLISKYITGERSLEGMLFRPTDFYEQNNINLLLGRRVNSLAPGEHTAELDSSEHITWDKLLIASGGVPIVPRIGGLGKKGVFNFITLDDAKAIDEFLDRATTAVVIGGGLIGTAVTEALTQRGVEVTVVEMKERILNTILDEQASLMAEEALEKAGVMVITGCTVAEIIGEESVTAVILSNGVEIPCSLVVVAIGVLPRTELLKGTDIKVNRGIAVNRHMGTNHPDIYACGDAAEAYDFVYGENSLTPIWPIAYLGGRIAGYNMARTNAEYPGGTAMNALNYFGLDIAAAGITIPPDEYGYEVLSKQNDGVYQKLVLKDDLLVGMVFVKDIEKSGIVFSLMRDGVNVHDFKQALLTDDFGLVSLPRELWHERLETPPLGLVLQPVLPDERMEDFAGE
jgi:NAD(P)H-nitrite reductase large subunit